MTSRLPNTTDPQAVHALLLQLDLAVEVLEGLDELGVDNRADLEALLSRLERQVADAECEQSNSAARGDRESV